MVVKYRFHDVGPALLALIFVWSSASGAATSPPFAKDIPDAAVEEPAIPGQASDTSSAFGRLEQPPMTRLGPNGPSHGAASSLASYQPTLGDGIWSETPPPRRRGSSAVFDAEGGRMIVFGGLVRGGAPRNDVWSMSVVGPPTWTRLTPAGEPPPPRAFHSAIMDPDGGRMLVFGGWNGAEIGDLWELNLRGVPAWRPLLPAGAGPTPRSDHSAIYDPLHRRMIVFGGWDGTFRNDTWSLPLDGPPKWIELRPAGPLPKGRYNHAAAYDPVHHGMLIFSGFAGDYTSSGPHPGYSSSYDTWELSLGDVPAWSDVTPLQLRRGGLLLPFDGHIAVALPNPPRVILQGGASHGYNLPTNYFWEVSATNFAVKVIGDPDPLSLYAGPEHAGIYDEINDRVLIYGGNPGLTSGGVETWALSGYAPHALALVSGALPGPSLSWYSGAAYDPVRDRFLVVDSGSNLWELRSAEPPGWRLVGTAGTRPPGRQGHRIVYDPDGDRLVLFGGMIFHDRFLDDAWALDLRGTPTWSPLTPEGAGPGRRARHSAILDSRRHRLIVYGGQGPNGIMYADAWALPLQGDAAWTRIEVAGPQPEGRFWHPAIYDPVGDRMIVYGGGTGDQYTPSRLFSDTWALTLGDPPRWLELHPEGPAPGPRWGHVPIYDPVRQRVVFDGGITNLYQGLPVNDVLALALESAPRWQWLAPAGGPGPALDYALAEYDPHRDRMILWSSDLWTLDWGDPAVRVAVMLKPGGNDDPAEKGPEGSIRFEILGTPDMDVTTIDPTTVTLSGAPISLRGQQRPKWKVVDLNHDGWMDVVAHVDARAFNPPPGAVMARLDGRTRSGVRVIGLDELPHVGLEKSRKPQEPVLADGPTMAPARLSIDRVAPNPSDGRFSVHLSLESADPASLEVWDIAGRRRLQRVLEGVSPGAHTLEFTGEAQLSPGLYWIRLRQGAQARVYRVVVAR